MKLPNLKNLKNKTLEAYQKSSKSALIFSHATWGIYYASSLYIFPTQTYNFERFIFDYTLSYGIFLGSYALYSKYEQTKN